MGSLKGDLLRLLLHEPLTLHNQASYIDVLLSCCMLQEMKHANIATVLADGYQPNHSAECIQRETSVAVTLHVATLGPHDVPGYCRVH